MKYNVVPFIAQIKRGDSAKVIAGQLNNLIDEQAKDGWRYLKMESVETRVAPENGCFGIGAKPGFTTIYKVIVFEKD